MKERIDFAFSHKQRAFTLAALIVVNTLCAAFFLYDVIVDLGSVDGPEMPHFIFELVASVALVVSTSYLLMELRHLIDRNSSMEIVVQAARGEMSDLIEQFFDRWSLSAAEQEVGLLLLKGFDNEAIAGIRGTAPGTVRAQCASIYAKAGVDSRSQLLSVFMEELLSEPLLDRKSDSHGA